MKRTKTKVTLGTKEEAKELAEELAKTDDESYLMEMEADIMFCGSDRTITIEYREDEDED